MAERTTNFRLLPVEAPPSTPVLFVETTDNMYSLAHYGDIERLEQEARLKAAAEIHQEAMRLFDTHEELAARQTLNRLMDFIERQYGKDNIVSEWPRKA